MSYVVYRERASDDPPILSEKDANLNLQEVNRIWRDCGIQFQIERYAPVVPDEYLLRYRTADYSELNDILSRFATDSTLLVVTTGEWDRQGTLGQSWANAWTTSPGAGPFGAILESRVADNPRILAHELGHYLGLGHVEKPDDLMNPVVYENSIRLDQDQCASARWVAFNFWKKMLR